MDGKVVSTFFLTPRMRVKKGSDSEEEVDPESFTDQISDQQIRQWLAKPLNRAQVDQQRVLVELSGDAPVGEAVPASAPEHWASLIKRIGTITDGDELEALYTGEERPKVRKALEDRMAVIG
jgi:hypothetical protein